MDKLAQLCIDQSGGKISKRDLTPSPSQQGRKKKAKGLAAKPPKPPPKVVWEEKTSPKRYLNFLFIIFKGSDFFFSPGDNSSATPPLLGCGRAVRCLGLGPMPYVHNCD